MIAEVLSVEQTEDGSVDIKCDPGGGAVITIPHFAPPGVDSRPLPGDFVSLEESAGSGSGQASGYSDILPSQAADGENRIYARNSAGVATAEIWLKGDGSISIKPLVPFALVTVAGGAEFVALADKVTTALQTLKDAITNAVVVPNDGGASLKSTILAALAAWPSDVASETLK